MSRLLKSGIHSLQHNGIVPTKTVYFQQGNKIEKVEDQLRQWSYLQKSKQCLLFL